MSYNLSVVLLCPAEHRDAINQLADALGYGPGNLSVELQDAQGGVRYGCHTWAPQAFLGEFSNPPTGFEVALAALVVSPIEGGEPASHWAGALTEHGLSVVVEAEV
jgi:hypothetical protein